MSIRLYNSHTHLPPFSPSRILRLELRLVDMRPSSQVRFGNRKEAEDMSRSDRRRPLGHISRTYVLDL